MGKNSRADSVVFGFDFQTNAAIVLMLENIKNLTSIRLEGNYEDIEIELTNGRWILAQAKSVVKASTDFSNVNKNLKKALESLSRGSQELDIERLIFITNSSNPLNDKKSMFQFLEDAHRMYDTLSEESKAKIQKYLKEVKQTISLEKFMIQVLPFETDDDRERYKIVRREIGSFLVELDIGEQYILDKIMYIWQKCVFINGSKRDVEIRLNKSDIMWPVMAIILERMEINKEIEENMDMALYDSVMDKYKKIIDYSCEKFEFFTTILYDFKNYKTEDKLREREKSFINNNWEEYKDIINTEDEEETEALIKIIISRVIRSRRQIAKIKEVVRL